MTQQTSLSDKKARLAALLQQKKQAYSYPLSYGQQALWFLYQNAPDSPAYNMAWPVEVRGDFNTAALPASLRKLVNRHPALRTTIHLKEKGPFQTVHPSGTCRFDTHRAEGWSESKLRASLKSACKKPFDLTKGPVLRVDLFQTGSQRHILLLTMHHIFGDAASMNILGNELPALCQAEQTGKKIVLSSLPAGYADFVRDETAMLNSAEGDKLAEYWKQQLGESSPVLDLPTDFPRPSVQTYSGDSLPFSLSTRLTRDLNRLAREEKTTLFCLLLAAFQIFLHRHTGQSEIRIGAPASPRRHDPRYAGIVGYLVNPVVLRAFIDSASGLSFRDLLAKTGQSVSEALEHADYPFPLLVKALQPRRDSVYSLLFQAMLDFKPASLAPANIPGLRITQPDMSQMEGQFDLTLVIHEGKRLKGRLNYNSDLFETETIRRMTARLEVLFSAIVESPEKAVNQLPILPEKEIRQLRSWNDTARDYPKDKTIADLFEEQVRKTPDNIALIFKEKKSTYRQLNEKANQLAHYLLDHGIGADPLVAVCLERSPEMVAGLLAILKAGGAYVPIDPEYPDDRIRRMLEDCGAKVLFTQIHLKAELPAAESNCHLLCLDENEFAGKPIENPSVARRADDLAYVIYTSGSTGTPKGAMNAQIGIVNRLLWMQEAYRLTPEDRVLQKTVFGFDVSVWEFFWPLITGAGLVMARPGGHKDPVYLASVISEQKVTTLHFVPSMLRTFLDLADVDKCGSLKRVICSGEALTPEHVRHFFAKFEHSNTELHNLYGPTEAAIDVSHWPCRVEDNLASIPIGKPVANTRLYVLDASRRIAPIGVRGELYIGGIQVGRGYLNRPSLTAKAFFELDLFGKTERVYKTGDLARWLPDGNLEYLGRMDHQIKLRGFRIELGEISSAILRFPGIRKCVVVARESDAGSGQLVAYMVREQRGDAETDTAHKLKAYLKQKLPEHMVPAVFMFLEALPLTANGKIDRKSLPAPEIRNTGYVCARDAAELRLVRLWEKLFDMAPISVRDDFFDMGGDSLLAMRLIFHVREEFNRELPLDTLFRNRTPEQLAGVLRRNAEPPAWSPMVCLQPDGEKTPLFFAHAAGGSAFNSLELASLLGTERPFYAIHPRGGEPGDQFHDSIEAMAADYMDAMCQIQPKGPYLMAGWSFGGTVVFEMARLLEQAGETVPILIMIDAPEPQAIVWKEDDAEFLLDRVPHFHGVAMDGLNRCASSEEKVAYLLKEIRMAGLLRPDINRDQARRWFDMYKHHNRLVGIYKPTCPVNSKVFFFKPAEKIPFDDQMGNPIEKWKPFAKGGLEVHEVPGNHFTMISPANTPKLAEMMKRLLE